MASNHETGPCDKCTELDSAEPIMDVRDMNKLFTKIDNLEHFPLKVLLNILTRLDYMDLYNLAENSNRFETIAKIALNEICKHEYLIIDESKHKEDTYIEFFDRFGKEIKAIYFVGIVIKGENHWITTILDKAKNLEKLTLCGCILQNGHLLQNHVNENITHLTLLRCTNSCKQLVVSKFRKLKKLEIGNDYEFGEEPLICFNTLEEVVRNNPALESLILGDKIKNYDDDDDGDDAVIRLYPFDEVMKLVGTHTNQLKKFAYAVELNMFSDLQNIPMNRQPNHIIDNFVNSLKHLESLALTQTIDYFTDINKLFVRLVSQCPNVKNLQLYDLTHEHSVLIKVVESFERLENLTLSFVDSSCKDEIESLVGHLPFLLDFKLEIINDTFDWSIILVLLRKCPSLQLITFSSDPMNGEVEIFGTREFFNQFIETIQNRKVKVQVMISHEIVGAITKNAVIWRKKLLYWTAGYDSSKNRSNIHLLDLAKHLPSASSNVEQRNPFNLILNYLDLKSLHSLANTSDKCLQLVENHVKQHSQQNGIFTITNEFVDRENGYYDGLEMFADYVVKLKVNVVVHGNFNDLKELFGKFCKLNELLIDSKACGLKVYNLVVPQVRHLVFNGEIIPIDFKCIYKLSCVCPDLETLKTEHNICIGQINVKSLKFQKLKKITFNFDLSKYNDVDTVDELKTLVEAMGTELCLIESFN